MACVALAPSRSCRHSAICSRTRSGAGPPKIVRRRTILGGPAPERVREQIAECRRDLEGASATHDSLQGRLRDAEVEVLRTARELAATG